MKKNSRTFYSEQEAAKMLAVSVDQLRAMVKTHIVKDDQLPEVALAIFQSSDLLILRILSGMASPSRVD